MNLKEKFITDQPVDNFIKIRQLDRYMKDHRGYIAGGVFKDILSDKKFKDIDIFFENASDYEHAKKYFESKEHFTHKYENDKATAFIDTQNNVSIELIKHKFLKPLDMINDFDFTITKFVYYKEEIDDEDGIYTERKVAYHKQFFEHLHMKRLVIDNDVDDIILPINTFNRMFRYARYGYFPCRETRIKIIEAIRRLPDFEEGMLSRELYNGVD